MRYLSVCSGIEAATVAWHVLGWRAWAFSEIEAFPSAVLAHHYPETPNLGDMTRYADWPDATLDVLVGGTPCQSFSVAGLGAGLADPRGGLLLTYLEIARRFRPRWVVWENVPGVLSNDDGRAFGTLLGGLAELGYGFAYRILDAQHFGLAQRRRRVFVVGHLGDWRRAAAVLFERASLSGHPAPRREARHDRAVGTLGGTSPGGGWRFGADEAAAGQLVAAYGGGNTAGPIDVATAVNAHGGSHGRQDFESETFIAHAFDARQSDVVSYGDKTGPLDTDGGSIAYGLRSDAGRSGAAKQPSLDAEGRSRLRDAGFNVQTEQAPTLDATAAHTVARDMMVRRLTPMECERLQGFADGYTAITYRGKPAADGPRYKALGNSMAVPCMAWLGRRIHDVEEALAALKVAG